jgi:hypothetical protein
MKSEKRIGSFDLVLDSGSIAGDEIGKPIDGHVKLRVRTGLADHAGVIDTSRTLAGVTLTAISVLAGAEVIIPDRISDVSASWDRGIAAGRAVVEIWLARAPALRITAAGRQHIAAAMRKRWAAYREAQACHGS